jgi:hypothetical protein
MIPKALVALAAPFVLSATQAPDVTPLYADIPEIHRVDCDNARGTAWRSGSGAYITARHVTHGRICSINGELVQVTWESAELDMAIIRTAVYGRGHPIDCSGFKDGEAVLAVGYARGLPVQRAMVLFPSDELTRAGRVGKFTALIGAEKHIPGMSGGALFNQRGEVVGIINAYDRHLPISYSQAMKESPLCP